MEALRSLQKVENSILKFEVPISFNSQYVEIIVLPYNPVIKSKEKKKKKEENLSEFQKLLLNGPVMTDSEFVEFQEKRNHFNKSLISPNSFE